MENDLLDGVPIKIGRKTYIVPPLPFKQLRKMLGKIDKIMNMSGMPTEEEMDAVVDVVHSAVALNYPEVTREEIDDSIDPVSATRAIRAISGASGLEQGEATGSR